MASGLVTVTPLLLFVAACVTVRALHLGMCQFIAPILSTLVAVFVFGEALTPMKSFVGLALLVGLAVALFPISIITRQESV